jgi:drug/metabolite transporter (DMT)-like permease
MSPHRLFFRQSREVQGMLLSLMSAACMGLTYVASKYVLRDINPETFVVFWFAMGSIYSLLLLTKRGRGKELFRTGNPWQHLVGIGLASAVAIILFFYAIQLIDPAIVSFYTRADNVFAVLLGVVFLRERFNSFEGVGVGIALLGSMVTTYRGGDLLMIGLGLCLISSVLEGVTVVLVKLAVRKVSPLVVIFYRSLLASTIALVYGFLSGRLQMPSGKALAIIAAASLGGSFMANVTFYAALARIDVTQATAIKTMQPFFVLLAAYLAFTTLPTSQQLLGGAIIVAGILCLLYGRRMVRRPEGQGTLVLEP